MRFRECCSKNRLLSAVVILASCFAVCVAYRTHCNKAIHPYNVMSSCNDKDVFTKIYKNKIWVKSSSSENVKDEEGRHPFIGYLQDFISERSISSVVDMGCGYGELLKDLNLPESTTYLGLDIVDSVIAYNKLNYERKNVVYDVVNDVEGLSKYSGDLLILKDVIQYWSLEKIMYAKSYILPRFRYAIIVNDIYSQGLMPVNSEIKTGQNRPLNLEISPFYMRLKVVKDYKTPSKGIKRIYLYESNGHLK